MKNLYFFILVFLASFSVKTQILNIPDVNLKNRLVNTNCAHLTSPSWLTDVDTNNDGQIQLSEAQNVLELDVSTNQFDTTNDILSMEGILSFSNLTKLDCSGNNFNALNLSTLNSLMNLNCAKSHLSVLNVSGLNNLQFLRCSFNSLTNLDLSGLSNLLYFYCVINSITSLDVSDSPLLINFQCEQNLINTLILGEKPALKTLLCNNNPISTINAQLFPNIEFLNCSTTSISTINLNGLSSLYSLELNSTLLSVIDCSQTGLWYHLYCSDNPNLTSINVRNNRIPNYDPDLLDFPFRFENLPNLSSICLDDGEQNLLVWTNYNTSGNVQLLGGANCVIPLVISTNGTEDYELKNSVVLFPNPTKNEIQLKSKSNIVIQSITIYNTLGQLIKTPSVSDINSQITLDVTSGNL